MTKYVKFISNTEIEYPPKNKDGIINYDKNLSKLLQDGYKELIELKIKVPQDSHIEYRETKENIIEHLIEPTLEQRLWVAKSAKLQENDTKRDEYLNAAILYKDLYWDSDLDQKINLGYKLDTIGDNETCEWVCADGVHSLECTKEDIAMILDLLIKKTTYVWQFKNPMLKKQILGAQTVDELNKIEIEYNLDEMILRNDSEV